MNGFILNTGDTIFSQTIIAPSITSAIVDHGLVLGYLMDTDPNSGDTLIESVTTFMTMLVYPDSIYLESDPFQPSPSAGIDFSTVPFRYVIIPGKYLTSGSSATVQTGTAQTYSAAQLKAMSYSTIKRIFNLPELFNLPKGFHLSSLPFARRLQ